MMGSKLKDEGWDQMSRSSKLAALAWPSLVPENIKAQIRTIPYGPGEEDPLTAKAGKVRNYDNLPLLKRKEK
jgi:hypothetical protein